MVSEYEDPEILGALCLRLGVNCRLFSLQAIKGVQNTTVSRQALKGCDFFRVRKRNGRLVGSDAVFNWLLSTVPPKQEIQALKCLAMVFLRSVLEA